jgi:type IV pilus assembly protein PilB
MSAPPNVQKRLLGEILTGAGLVSPDQLEQALQQQKENGGRLGFNLVRLGYISATALTSFLEENFGVGIIQEQLTERQKAADAIPRHLALYYRIAPIKIEGDTLTIAIAQIEHPNLLQALSDVTGYKIDAMIYPEQEIRSLLDSSYKVPTERGLELFSFNDNVFAVIDTAKKIKPLAAFQLVNERDVGEWLRSIVAEAIKEKSREILIKPESDGASVSFKKDTFFLSDFALAPALHDDMTFLLFRLAKMNPIQQQKPQHGRFIARIHDRKIVMVVSAFPTIYGFRFLLEMFDERLLRRGFDEMTQAFPDLKARLEDFLFHKKQGICLITAPDGSGRTSFLYSLLLKCKEDYRHVMTLEDRVRYPIQGLNQTQVQEGEMEEGLENILSQKPDLVAIHTLRSLRSAELAFLIGARTPVIAVMSSYDSFVAVDWLCRHNLRSAVKAGLLHTVISSRLLPRACPSCSIPFEPTAQQFREWKLPPDAQMKINQGCDYCRNPDNQATELIFEVVAVDPEFIGWIESNHSAASLRQHARQAGRHVLFDVALQHAVRGELDTLSVVKLQSVL